MIDARSLSALLLEWAIIVATIVLAIRLAHAATWIAAVLIIATRQHALLMLYHDAVHGLLARNRQLNDFLVNLLVGVPHLVPIETYRPLHLQHHRELGTDADPERTLLYAGQRWQYRPLQGPDLLRQLAGDLFLVNGVRTIVAAARQGRYTPPRPATLLPLTIWIALLAGVFYRWPEAVVPLLLLWLLPLLTVTNLLQKLRSFAEHSGGPGVTPGWDEWTYSWQPGWLGRLTIWPYNINRHLEHHRQPWLPWHQLSAVASDAALDGRTFPAVLLQLRGSPLQHKKKAARRRPG